jgi:hypothetical protein
MTVSNPTHPLGFEETDEIDSAVARALTAYQVEWLLRQCSDLRLKKLQLLRQALFEWVAEHPDYRFSAATFGSAMQLALEEFIRRHTAEFVPLEPAGKDCRERTN